MAAPFGEFEWRSEKKEKIYKYYVPASCLCLNLLPIPECKVLPSHKPTRPGKNIFIEEKKTFVARDR